MCVNVHKNASNGTQTCVFRSSGRTRRRVACAARKDPPDYAERRRGGQDENNRRRTNAHQHALRGRPLEAHNHYDGPPAFARAHSRKGTLFDVKTRRRGRPAHLRSPDDSPLRDGNRDRLIGLLTERAARTLLCYFMETNLNYHHWLSEYIKQNPIPLSGSWDDVSGETFLRKLLTGGISEAKAQLTEDLFSCVRGLGIDARMIAQRIMEIRKALASEFIQDLECVAEENAILMREVAMASFASSMDSPAVLHPEMMAAVGTIPDTAAQFLLEAKESTLERFQRQRAAGEGDAAVEGRAAADDDAVRPGVDDINEFESELEAPDKWKRRFRLMKQEGGGDAASTSPDGPESGSEDAGGDAPSGAT